MTRKEAIKILKDLSDCSHIGSLASEDIEALEMAISSLETDAIPRERIEQMVAEIKDRRSKHNCSCSDCLDIIDKYTKEQNNE